MKEIKAWAVVNKDEKVISVHLGRAAARLHCLSEFGERLVRVTVRIEE